MALKDRITLGMSLPHRSPEPIDMNVVRQVAQRAEALGFRDLWVTENTLDHVFSFDPFVVLTYAAAIARSLRVGLSLVALAMQNHSQIAQQVAQLHHLSNRQASVSDGVCRQHTYTRSQVPR